VRYDEFLARVQELGEYEENREAERISRAVLKVLAGRMTAPAADHLAAQLPETLDQPLQEGRTERPGAFGVEEFLRQVSAAVGARPRTAEWDASAVLCTMAEAISGGELNKVLSQLPSDFAALFGKPELSH
jgi:uncharacterized protein (DUF2267 family)